MSAAGGEVRPVAETIRRDRSARILAVVIVGGGLLALGGLGGHPVVALVLVGGALVAVQARALAPRFTRAVDHGVARAAAASGRALARVALTVAFVAIVLPVSLVGLPFRRGPMGRPRKVAGWIPREPTTPSTATRHQYVARSPRPRPAPSRVRRPATRRAPISTRRALGRVAGVVVIVMVIDLALGAVFSGTRLLLGDRARLRALQQENWEETMRSPAIRDEPWAEQYGRDQDELASRPQEYVPYLVWGFQEYRSRWVNTTDRERRSYQPELPPGTRPLRVAFFGGSVMFGIGQRDEHTIPSQFARLAERAGIPVQVHNYGMYGWVRWQEYQYLERLLAAGEHYDLLVFYDGLNDYMVQFSDPSADPTHGGSRILLRLGSEIHRTDSEYPGFLDGVNELATTYRRSSGVARLVDRVVNGPTRVPEWLAAGPVELDDASRAALDVYGRSGRAVSLLAEDSGIPVRFFLQATQIEWTPEQRSQFPPRTRDYSDVFDGIESSVYIDGAHTNELGARLVAERMWRDLEPDLVRALDQNQPAD